jgi:hypothetical protein
MQQLYTLLGIYVERLEIITAKLAEAEVRIKQLESEKEKPE